MNNRYTIAIVLLGGIIIRLLLAQKSHATSDVKVLTFSTEHAAGYIFQAHYQVVC
jgi:hypothetical protein